MKITHTHIVVERGSNGPDTTFTTIIVHVLEDGNYFKVDSRGYLKPITRKEFMDMEINYYDMFKPKN